nr:hypothetical protein [Nitrospina gracilis]
MQRQFFIQRALGERFIKKNAVARQEESRLHQFNIVLDEIREHHAIAVEKHQPFALTRRHRLVANGPGAESLILMPHMFEHQPVPL